MLARERRRFSPVSLHAHAVQRITRETLLMRINPNHWKQVLQRLIDDHNWQHASKPKIVSNKTMHERAHFLFHFFGELRRNDERSYKIDPRNLGSRHVHFMVNRWVKRGLAPATIQLYLSYLRVFGEWIGKPGSC
jgi:hypothetical protein